MAKSIAEYTAEVSKSYDNSRQALQKQIDAISGNLAQTQKQINENYANQQNQLNAQRDQAAEAASLRAAGSGGSFGGAANIANRKYYEQSFVPAQTQLNTNQSQALENAQSQANNNRLTLESQLAAMSDEIARLGAQRYYDELDRERQERLARQQLAAQNAWQKYVNNQTATAAKANKYDAKADTAGGFYFTNNGTGKTVKFGTAYFGNGGARNNGTILQNVGQLFGTNSNEYNRLSEILKYNGKKNLTNAAGKTYNYNYLSKTDSDLLNRLGLRLG